MVKKFLGNLVICFGICWLISTGIEIFLSLPAFSFDELTPITSSILLEMVLFIAVAITLVLLIKNLMKYFEFAVTIIDDKNIERTFKSTNFQTLTRVKGNFCSLPMKLEDGWNQVHIDLDDFCKKAFGTNYKETKRVQVHANVRIRRIYFTEFPVDYKKIPPE